MKYRLCLLAGFAIVWLWAAIHPYNREDWFLENILVFIFIPVIIILGEYFKISNFSYTLIALYMILHIFGTHFSYIQVPFGYFIEHLIGAPRNMYDRFMHFSFGLLIAYPIREAFLKVARVKGFWSFFFPIELIFAWSALYEIMEWLVAKIVSPQAAFAFLGSQGDIWDTQKDMLVAGVGAIISMAIIFAINIKIRKGFLGEVRESVLPLENGREWHFEVPRETKSSENDTVRPE